MDETIPLCDVPERFLDNQAWRELLEFARSKTSALALLNSPRPEGEMDLSWGPAESMAEDHARFRRFENARNLTQAARELFRAGTLVAFGYQKNMPDRVQIPKDRWEQLHPMFATNRAVWMDLEFSSLQVIEAEKLSTPHERMHSRCVSWLQARRVAGERSKKQLKHEAFKHFGPALTDRMFEVAYKIVFDSPRGRPRKH